MGGYFLGLGADADQARILAAIRTQSGDAIQVSDGICLKIPLARAAIEELLRAAGVESPRLTAVEDAADKVTADVRAFLDQKA